MGSQVGLFTLADKKFRIYRKKTSTASADGAQRRLPGAGSPEKASAAGRPAAGKGAANRGRSHHLRSLRSAWRRRRCRSANRPVPRSNRRVPRAGPWRGQPESVEDGARGIALRAADGVTQPSERARCRFEEPDCASSRRGVGSRSLSTSCRSRRQAVRITWCCSRSQTRGATTAMTLSRSRPGAPSRRARRRERQSEFELLERELAASREYLQSIIQELEAANEELQSANEEILSSNEELQSTNEELDTAKEELQSTNEELNTLNEELHGRNEELSRVNSDLVNLLASVQIAIVIISSDLRIRRFTPMAEKVLNLIPGDLDRPIGHIKPNIDCPDLEQLDPRGDRYGRTGRARSQRQERTLVLAPHSPIQERRQQDRWRGAHALRRRRDQAIGTADAPGKGLHRCAHEGDRSAPRRPGQ